MYIVSEYRDLSTDLVIEYINYLSHLAECIRINYEDRIEGVSITINNELKKDNACFLQD